MEQKEFTLKKLPNFTFRVGKISPVEYLTLNTFVDFNDFSKTEKCFDFILTHTEVNLNGVWNVVKEGDLILPLNLCDNLPAMEELVYYFLHEVLIPLFQDSKE